MKTLSVLLILSLTILAGCASRHLDLVEQNTVKVEKVSSGNVIIDTVRVHQHQDKMEVEVVVRPKERVMRFVSGDIRVEVVEPGGVVFTTVNAQAIRPHSDIGSKLQHAHFWCRFPIIPKPGTIIRVTSI